MMKAKEIREKNINELNKILTEKQDEVRKLRFDIASKQEKNHRDLRNMKKEIARIKMIIKSQGEN